MTRLPTVSTCLVTLVGLTVLAALGVGCSTAAFASGPSSTGQLARCNLLYGLWRDYDQDPVFYHTGERAKAELALYHCQHGDYAGGAAFLESLLKRGKFASPESLGQDLVQPANVDRATADHGGQTER